MKRSMFLTLLLMAAPVLMWAQKSQVQQLFDKYDGQEGYTSIFISKYMFELFAKIADDEEDKEFKDITSKLQFIKILTYDEDASRAESFHKEILKTLPSSSYQELMIIREGKEEIKFLTNEKDSKISELVMVIGGDGDTMVMALVGDIDLKQISKLSKSMDIKGFEHLEGVDEKKEK